MSSFKRINNFIIFFFYVEIVGINATVQIFLNQKRKCQKIERCIVKLPEEKTYFQKTYLDFREFCNSESGSEKITKKAKLIKMYIIKNQSHFATTLNLI